MFSQLERKRENGEERDGVGEKFEIQRHENAQDRRQDRQPVYGRSASYPRHVLLDCISSAILFLSTTPRLAVSVGVRTRYVFCCYRSYRHVSD